jgi:hypothetical protein
MDRISKTEIAKAFSIGEFEGTYKHLSNDAEWKIVEEKTCTGKQAIIDHCEQVAAYFKSVSTDFKTLNIISNQDTVVVEGTAAFKREGQNISFVSACDIYEFNDKGQIQKITSYCIPAK